MPVNAAFLNTFVYAYPKQKDVLARATKLKELSDADPTMDQGLKVATTSFFKNAQAGMKDCEEIADRLGITF